MAHSDASSSTTAAVVLGLPLATPFHYRIPGRLLDLVRRGTVVVVPFGRRLATGYVVGVGPAPADAPADLKPIREVLEPEAVPPELFTLLEFIADYYLASLGEVMRAALPAMSIKSEQRVSLTDAGRAALHGTLLALSLEDLSLLESLERRRGPVKLSAITPAGADPRPLLRALESRGLVTLELAAARAGLPRRERMVTLALPGDEARAHPGIARSPLLRALVDHLLGAGAPVAWREASSATRATVAHLRKLVALGLATTREVDVAVDVGGASSRRLSSLELTAAQREVVTAVVAAMDGGGFAPFLLHGVTGSGKSLVYLAVIEAALARGRSALLLVPEIALTPVLARELRGRFGDSVAVIHSAMTPGQRYDAWRRARSGRARVVFGARSAVLAPMANLGVVIVDEEHDASYKQDERPHYHARDVAVSRASLSRIPVVLGSATPSLESYRNAKEGRYRLLELSERAAGQRLPRVEIVDMRDELLDRGSDLMLSARLKDALQARLTQREQSVLLLNRRGYASFLLCRECGVRHECPNCSVCLTYHRAEQKLKCHHCDHRESPPKACAACGGLFLHLVGHGTEKVEAAVRELVPAARIARLDRDAAARRGEAEEVLARFERGDIDILIGTQMVAKGHDFPNVTLVGIVSVDALLALPDFRATERAFALMTQVAGRAGRGERAGEVVLQTFHPTNDAVRLACEQDYPSFFAREIGNRKLMRYPPLTTLANLMVKGVELERVKAEARAVALVLARHRPPSVRILGPAMAPVQRKKRAYRAQMMLKSASRAALREMLRLALPELEAHRARGSLDIDMDPQDLM